MNRLFMASVLALVLVLPAGCCTARNAETGVSIESYDAALGRIRVNLIQIRANYSEALKRSDLLPATFPAKLGLVDDTVRLIDGTLSGGTVAPVTTRGNK